MTSRKFGLIVAIIRAPIRPSSSAAISEAVFACRNYRSYRKAARCVYADLVARPAEFEKRTGSRQFGLASSIARAVQFTESSGLSGQRRKIRQSAIVRPPAPAATD